MTTNDVPKFNLNLSQAVMSQASNLADDDDLPIIPSAHENKQNNSKSTAQRTRSRQQKSRGSRVKNSVILEHSDSSSDIELGDDLTQIPSNKEPETKQKDTGEIPAVSQINALPEFDDDEDDAGETREKDKLSLLFDLLLTADQCEEPQDEWNVKSFIKDYAKSEAKDDDNYNEFEEEEDESNDKE